MKPRTTATRGVSGLSVLFLFAFSLPAAAQSPASPGPDGGVRWGLINGIGYGGLGFGLGLAVTWDLESDGFGPPGAAIVITGASTAAGIFLGAVTGNRARNRIAAGHPLSGAHRVAVVGGGVAAGGTLGALAAVPLINGEGEGTFLGSDEQTFALLVAAGSALGTFYVWRNRAELSSPSISLTPEITESRQYGLRVRLGLR